MSRLIALSDNDKMDIQSFELITLKDPAAIARLLSLSNSALFCRGAKIRTVREAVKHIGTETCFDALLAIFSLDMLQMPYELTGLRNYVTRHIFSVLTTARRLEKMGCVTEAIDGTYLALTVIADKLGIALELGRPTGAVLPFMLKAMGDNRHLYHSYELLDEGFKQSPEIGRQWMLPDEVVEDLDCLSKWRQCKTLSQTVMLVLSAEAIVDAKHGTGNEMLAKEPFRSWDPILNLFDRNLDPVSMAQVW